MAIHFAAAERGRLIKKNRKKESSWVKRPSCAVPCYLYTYNTDLTVSNDLDNLHICMNYYKTTNQPILSALLLMTCLRLLVLDLLHLVPLDILQLPPGTLHHSIVTLSLLLNVD